VVSRVKRLLPRKTKVGHTGTLDPLASGLLVLLLARATRLSRYVTGLDKRYTATARFGAVADTLDAEGKITSLEVPMPHEDALRAALPSLTGDLLQIPPMASAVRVNGEHLYDLHRRGLTVERESRSVTIHSLTLTSTDPEQQEATFEISCSSGTYVRTLISDLATSLGTGAYLTALRRTSVGHLRVADAARPENLSKTNICHHIIQITQVLSHLPVVEVSEDERRAICNGRVFGVSGVRGSFRVEVGGELLAVYRGDGREARAEVVLCGG
jgi:tRNA pseudouridine55 synthase